MTNCSLSWSRTPNRLASADHDVELVCDDGVAASPARDGVAFAIPGGDPIVTCASDEPVAPRSAVDPVVAGATRQDVRARAADKTVRAWRADLLRRRATCIDRWIGLWLLGSGSSFFGSGFAGPSFAATETGASAAAGVVSLFSLGDGAPATNGVLTPALAKPTSPVRRLRPLVRCVIVSRSASGSPNPIEQRYESASHVTAGPSSTSTQRRVISTLSVHSELEKRAPRRHSFQSQSVFHPRSRAS